MPRTESGSSTTAPPALRMSFDKRAYVFHGTITVASIRLWLKP
ncbi:hypothetical protein AB0D91_47830 [Streptomyces canus]